MADYHPLDTRYKGPTTAYRGSSKRRARDVEAATPPPAPATKGPWDAGPPPLPVPGAAPNSPGRKAPPPLPPASPPPVPRKGAAWRVVIGAAVLIAFVLANQLIS